MKKIKFSVNNVVRININFRESGGQKLATEFHKFLAVNNINYTAGSNAGLDFHIGYYIPEDAADIEKWLLRQDADLELEDYSLLPLLIKIKDVIMGLKMFLENVKKDQIEKIALKIMEEAKPEHKELLLAKMTRVYGYSPAVREFAKKLVKKLLEECGKGRLTPKTELSLEQVLSIRIQDAFSTQTANSLVFNGFETIHDLTDSINRNKFNLLKIRNFGKTSLSEVNAFLRLYNI